MEKIKYTTFVDQEIVSPIILEFVVVENDESNQSEDLVNMHIDNMLANFKADLVTLRQTKSLKNVSMICPKVPISEDDFVPGLYVKFRGNEEILHKVIDDFKSQGLKIEVN